MAKLTFHDTNNIMMVSPLENGKIKFEIGPEYLALNQDDVELLIKVLAHYNTNNIYPTICYN